MNKIYNKYLKDLDDNNKSSNIYKIFLNYESKEYIENNSNKRIVIDYISLMTDAYFQNEYNSILENK